MGIGPHVIRLRPAPHCRTRIDAYSLTIKPTEHFLNWQQDPFGNYLARAVFPNKAAELEITVGLIADMTVINPFDFFIEDYAQRFPFHYPAQLADDLKPYLQPASNAIGPGFEQWLAARPPVADDGQQIVDFLRDLTAAVYRDVAYSVRMETGVQTPDQTLSRGIGSCRDSSWLLVTALRRYGLAARFVSGYLVQLAPDQSALERPSGPVEDFTDLHAWAEVFVPGAGWIGLDPTSALFAGEGHIPLAATPHPSSAAAITGATEPCQVTLEFANTVRRVHEDPRVSKPYTSAQLDHLHRLGRDVDERLAQAGVELTMGGEPTFVSMDNQTAAEWTVAADGMHKRELANNLANALWKQFAGGGILQRSQGKWYPGEAMPRWQIGLIWRKDGEPLWEDPDLLADPFDAGQADEAADARAEQLAKIITQEFGLPVEHLQPCYEDPLAQLAEEVARPTGPRPDVDPQVADLDLIADVDRQAEPVAWVLPLAPAWWGEGWASAAWRTRRGRLVLVPGHSPAGFRLPLGSLSWQDPEFSGEQSYLHATAPPELEGQPRAVIVDPDDHPSRTALVVQPRDGFVHVFLPPLEKLEKFVELVRLVSQTAAAHRIRLILEGYGPPPDPRINHLLITPDPGVLEVNLHPSSSWDELSELTHTLFRLAAEQRLGTETFGLDGRHSGTGGGNHITLGAAEPARSPLLRRPDLLVSMLTYWQHHPSLSYLFSGRFVGSTSQAPRVDEGRPEKLYELEIAFAEIEKLADNQHRPWAVDRALRYLLTDVTGNTHRSEFCIDKLYNPDSLAGRLGLLELRAFEMPPHPDMALVQALLVRALVVRFVEDPYSAPLIRWGTLLHEKFLLPHFAMADVAEVIADLRAHGIDFDRTWLAPNLEFRFPRIGIAEIGGSDGAGVELELRTAIEPWQVLSDDATSGAAARYVDSSTERIQVSVSGFNPARQLLICNGSPVPLVSAGTPGYYVAGIRYKAWKPWSALHPTLGIDAPLQIELIDRGAHVSLGGVTYAVAHPGGRYYDTPPVNAQEAEARRHARFEASGHTPGAIDVEALGAQLAWWAVPGADYVCTLDLRRRVPRRWGRA